MEDLAHNDTILWYRADWLDKLNLKPPKTLDELHDVALAIVNSKLGKAIGSQLLVVGCSLFACASSSAARRSLMSDCAC